MQEDSTTSSDYIAAGSDIKELFFLFEKAPFAMSVLKGSALTIEIVNEKLLEIWGRGKEDVIGKPLLKCFPELKDTDTEKIFKTAYKTGEKFVAKEYETSFFRNGELHSAFFDLNIDPIIHVDGSVRGLLVTSTDVTTQVLARKKIEENEHRLQLLTDAIPSLISYVNRNLQFQFNNKGYERWFGHTAEEIKGKTIKEVVGEEAYRNIEAHIKKVLSGETVSYEAWVPYKDGGKRFISATYVPHIDDEDEVVGFYALVNDITERKKAESILKESEKKNRRLLEFDEAVMANMVEGLYTVDENGLVTSMNAVAEKLFGWTFEELKGKKMHEMTHYKHRDGSPFPAEECPGLQVLTEGKTLQDFEDIFIKKDGSFFDVTYSSSPIIIDGKINGLIVVFRDITERKKIEQALSESEEKNRLFIKYSPAAMAMFDKEMRYVSVSNQWMKDYDLEGDIIGKNHYELFPNILQRWKDVHSRCLNGTVEKADEDFYVKDDGTPVWLKWEVHPWYNLTGEIGGIVIFTENISDRKKTQQLIKESEERFRMLATEAPLFVWLTNEKLQTTYLNKAGLDYFDLDESIELSEFSWKKFIHPDDLPMVLDTMDEAAEKHESYTLEMRLKNGKTGEYHWFLDNGTPKYVGEEFKGFIGTSLDIHQKKEAEELKYEKQKLELQKALESDKLKSDFIKMASHELKTPVTSIKGFVQLLLSMLNEPGEKELSPLMVKSSLVSIEKQVNRLTRLISELLDISRLETGHFELNLEEQSINELMIEIVQDVIYTKPKQQINLYHEYECKVVCDKDRLSQAVLNLLTNAIKYSPGADKVDVTISKHSDSMVAVSIKDYGVGIEKKEFEKIFERFYRAEGKTELTYPGFGIGLYIAREIVQLHGGEIKVQSEKASQDDPRLNDSVGQAVGRGKGSIFTFTLPFKNKNEL